jgi:hypothetical protein
MWRLLLLFISIVLCAYSFLYSPASTNNSSQLNEHVRQIFVSNNNDLVAFANNTLVFLNTDHQQKDSIALNDYGITQVNSDIAQQQDGSIVFFADKYQTGWWQNILKTIHITQFIPKQSGYFICSRNNVDSTPGCSEFVSNNLPQGNGIDISIDKKLDRILVHKKNSNTYQVFSKDGQLSATWKNSMAMSKMAAFKDMFWVLQPDNNSVKPVSLRISDVISGDAISLRSELGRSAFDRPISMSYSGSEWWVLMQNPQTLQTKLALFSNEFGIGAFKRFQEDFQAHQLVTWNKHIYALQTNKSVITKFSPRDGKHQTISLRAVIDNATNSNSYLSPSNMFGGLSNLSDLALQITFVIGCIGILIAIYASFIIARIKSGAGNQNGWLYLIQSAAKADGFNMDKPLWVNMAKSVKLSKWMSEFIIFAVVICLLLVAFKMATGSLVFEKLSELGNQVILAVSLVISLVALLSLVKAHRHDMVGVGVMGGRLLIKDSGKITAFKATEIFYSGDEIVVADQAVRFRGVYNKTQFLKHVAPILQYSKEIHPQEVRRLTGSTKSMFLPLLHFVMILLVIVMMVVK